MNDSQKEMTSANQNNDQVAVAFQRANQIVFKDYLKTLSKLKIKDFEIPKIRYESILQDGTTEIKERELCVSDKSAFFRVSKLVYDSDENNIQKMTSVYSAMAAIHANPALIIISNGMRTELYLGICNENDRNRIRTNAEEFCNNIAGNFQGSLDDFEKIRVDKDELLGIINRCLSSEQSVVSAVSGVASIRKKEIDDNDEFSQGIEKLLDTMHGKPFSAIFIANSVSPEELSDIKAEYELLYSSLVPFAKSTLTINDSQSDSITKSLSKSLADTVGKNSSTALSIGTSESQSHQEGTAVGQNDTLGGSYGHYSGVNVGANGVGANAGSSYSVNYSHSIQRTKSFSDTTTFGKSETSTKTEGESTAQTISKTDTDGTTKTYTVGKSLQISCENKTITNLLTTIDAQLERIKASESFGMFATSAYFIATSKPIAQMAASSYKAIMSGQNTGLEVAAINTWDKGNGFDKVAKYLAMVQHPVFELDDINCVTPASLVSAQEMAIQMGLPNQSTAGVTVIETASFGRNITKVDSFASEGEKIKFGSLYHMGQTVEEYPVELDIQSLSMHAFITGSTGSGKSNTVYQLLDKLTKKKKTFLVVEPTKGEYKSVFGGRPDVSVYGTNYKTTELLRINPFSFPNGIQLYAHLDRLIEIFNACWPMYAAMPAVLKDAMERAYVDAGWDLASSENPHGRLFPNFVDVLRQIDIVMNESDYSGESKGDYKGALKTRLKSLTNGVYSQIFTSDECSEKDLFDRNVIVDLSEIGTETTSLIMGVLVLKLQEYRMASKAINSELKHITVLEEAHNLLKRTSTEQSAEGSNLVGKSVEMITNAIAEMRTYGECFMIVDQAPGALDPAAIRNTNTKIILRLPDFSDRELVGKAIALNDYQIVELSKLERGVAAVYQSGWIESVLCKFEKFEKKDPLTQRDMPTRKQAHPAGILLNAILYGTSYEEFSSVVRGHRDLIVRRSNLPVSIKREVCELCKSEGPVSKEHLCKIAYELVDGETLFVDGKEPKEAEIARRLWNNHIDDSAFKQANLAVLIELLHQEHQRRENELVYGLQMGGVR